jgi:class 3 adenylate cyclase
MSITVNLGLAIGLAACAVIFFGIALSRGWFAHYEHGFSAALMGVAVGGSIITAVVFGVWSYERGRTILFQSLVDGMNNLGNVVEEQTNQDIEAATAKLKRVSQETSLQTVRGERTAVQKNLDKLIRVDRRLLQIDIIDAKGELVLASAEGGEPEPLNRIAVAFGLEGKTFASSPYYSTVFKRDIFTVAVPVHDASGRIIEGVVSARYDIQDDLAQLLGVARFGKSGYVTITDENGRIIAHPDPARLLDDISGYPAVREAELGHTGWFIGRNKAGKERLFVYRPVRNPATVNPRPLALIVEIDAAEALAPIRSLAAEYCIGLFLLLLLCSIVGWQLVTAINKPVGRLVRFARIVQGGDLTQRVEVIGHDEIGQLGGALNEMVRGLGERDRMKEIFGRYVTTQVSEKILKGQINLGGKRRCLTMLFSDIRNFTAMAETMAPEDVVSFLNEYFSEMVDAVFEQSGVLDKFIGDGLLAVFGSIEEMPDHPRRAVLTALRMKALLGKINGERGAVGKPPIAIGIGVHTDEVVVGNIGSRQRLEYTVIGDGVNTCSRVESLNKTFGTTILITEATYLALGEGFNCREMPEAELKGKTHVPKIYEVISFSGSPPSTSEGADDRRGE